MPVPITDYISTTDPLDTFPTHDSLLGKGGYREVATLVELYNITAQRRRVGMLAYVLEDGKVYLLAEATTPVWVEFAGGGGGSDLNYVHDQTMASNTWVIPHNLGKHPSVTVLDSAGTYVIGDIQYDNLYTLTLHFSAAMSGKAYLN